MKLLAEKLLGESEVLEITDKEFADIRKGKDVKKVSMVGGKNGADYEVIYKDHSYKLFKIKD